MRGTLAATWAVGILAVATAAANTLLVDIDNPDLDFTNGNDWTLGYAFHVESPITVYGFAVYDDLQDGLAVPHAAGLWDSAGTLLASATIPAGTAAPLIGMGNWFRWTAMASPMTLPVGDYTVGVRTETENYTWNAGTFSVHPNITFLGDRYIEDPALAMPTTSDGIQGWFGGTIVVPEPGQYAMLAGLGLVMFGCFRRMSRRNG